MSKRSLAGAWAKVFARSAKAIGRAAVKQQSVVAKQAARTVHRAAKQATKTNTTLARQARARNTAAVGKAVQAVAEQQRFPRAPGDWLPGLAVGPAGVRRFHLYRPASLGVPAAPVPLVVMLHGCTQNARGFAVSTRMHKLAERHGFFVLFPDQDTLAHPQGCWRWFDRRAGHAQTEAQTLVLMIDQVRLRHPIDPARIVVAGLSAGAGMAALMALREPARFAAVVMHSGVAPGSAQSAATALQSMHGRGHVKLEAALPLPPLLVLHGSEDGIVAPANGRAAAEAWAVACRARPTGSKLQQRGERRPMTVSDWRLGRRTVVRLCEVEGLGHAWSGGDRAQPFGDPAGPDASALLWRFAQSVFQASGLPAAAPRR